MKFPNPQRIHLLSYKFLMKFSSADPVLLKNAKIEGDLLLKENLKNLFYPSYYSPGIGERRWGKLQENLRDDVDGGWFKNYANLFIVRMTQNTATNYSWHFDWDDIVYYSDIFKEETSCPQYPDSKRFRWLARGDPRHFWKVNDSSHGCWRWFTDQQRRRLELNDSRWWHWRWGSLVWDECSAVLRVPGSFQTTIRSDQKFQATWSCTDEQFSRTQIILLPVNCISKYCREIRM